ncbi:MAG TPA: hypothetical protein VM286_01460 [Candidatus Thermoplasmatota archaeon]|nr:hypothetical protein [Candidatus Thermoplasmatota archaeon]
MALTLDNSIPQFYGVLLHKLKARLYAQSACITVQATHPKTDVTARLTALGTFYPDLIVTFTRQGADPPQVHFVMGKDGRMAQCDDKGKPLAAPTVQAIRQLVGSKTFLQLVGLPWARTETHDLSEHLEVRLLPTVPLAERTHKVVAPVFQELPERASPLRVRA